MKHTGLKNEQFINELTISGSTAIKTKNDFGIHVFSGSIDNDGVVSSKLVKPKYNNAEIEKSIDISIVELIPISTPELPDTVLRSIYNGALRQIDDLTLEVARLNGVVLELQSNITELQIVTQSLRVELDGKDILIASLENQNQQANSRIQSTIINLQNSIQRSTSEAIQRVSLTARNEALLQEIESLRIELELSKEKLEKTTIELTREASIGAELAKGAFGGNDLTVNPNPITDSSISPIAFRGRKKNNYRESSFINGNTLSIFNASDDTVTVNFEQSNLNFLNNISPVTVRSKAFATVTLTADINKIDRYRGGKDSLNVGELIVSTPTNTFPIPMELQIQVGAKYKRP
jgi:hypothetical protein